MSDCDIDLFYHYCNQMIKYRNAPKSIFNLFSKPNPPVQPDNCPDISNLSDDDIKEKYEISGNYDYKDYIDFANNYHTLKQLNMSKPNMSIKTIKTLGPYQTTAQRLKDEKEMLLVNLTEIRSFSPPSKRKQASIIARLKEIQEEINENETNKSESVRYKRGGKHFKPKTFKRKNSKRRKTAKINSSKK